MTGQRIGYIRISSHDQNPKRQLENVQCDRTFIDKVSGKDINRPKLQELLDFVRDGDQVVVHSMDRLARNLDDLRGLVQRLTGKGVSVEFLHEHLTFTGEDTPMANLLLSVMGAFAEFERALIRERQLEGIALAKQRGVYKGRKKVLTAADLELIRAQLAEPIHNVSRIARERGISRSTLHLYLSGKRTPAAAYEANPNDLQ
jgi:DNA invertase Pin-like site-specific DNA recombinase